MRIEDRYQLVEELSERYAAGKRLERSAILNAFCLATGYHRKYALALLRGQQRRRAPHQRRPRLRRYGPPFRHALKICWEASGYICSERLQPFLPELVPVLERHEHLRLPPPVRSLLLEASVATVERNLRDLRRGLVSRRLSQTKPGGLLRRQIPVIVGEWKEKDQPGYLEIDLVSHSGEFAVGEFMYTLSAVDLSSGWSERVPVMGRGQEGVTAALDRIRRQLPFPLRGLHPDNGSEFVNWHLLRYCEEHGIALSRGRPFHKNDNAHVEQKNWTLVRRLIGYQRLDTREQLAWLDRLYTDLLRPYANCFQPVMKLIKKETVGQRRRKVYDRPTTPLRRVLASGAADPDRITALVTLYTATSPLTLKRQLDRALARKPATVKEVAYA